MGWPKKFGPVGLAAAILSLSLAPAAYAAPLPGEFHATTASALQVEDNIFNGRRDVYLNAGPFDSSPDTLPPRKYVFQVTDPDGAILLSQDPARCRVVQVNNNGVLSDLLRPSGLGLGLNDSYIDGKTQYECSIVDSPDYASGIFGRQGTNHDPYHQNENGIVAQLMPFLNTTDHAGRYRLSVIPLNEYLDRDNLGRMPAAWGALIANNRLIGYNGDPGFAPPNDSIKTVEFIIPGLTAATPTPISTKTPMPTETPLPASTPTAVPTRTPRPTMTPLPTWTPLPTMTPLPANTPTTLPTAMATRTPRPTATPCPCCLKQLHGECDHEHYRDPKLLDLRQSRLRLDVGSLGPSLQHQHQPRVIGERQHEYQPRLAHGRCRSYKGRSTQWVLLPLSSSVAALPPVGSLLSPKSAADFASFALKGLPPGGFNRPVLHS